MFVPLPKAEALSFFELKVNYKKSPQTVNLRALFYINGGDYRARTYDPILVRDVLSQLLSLLYRGVLLKTKSVLLFELKWTHLLAFGGIVTLGKRINLHLCCSYWRVRVILIIRLLSMISFNSHL